VIDGWWKSAHTEPSGKDFQAVNDVVTPIEILWILGEVLERFTQHLPGRIWVHRSPFFVTRLVGIEDEYIWVILEDLHTTDETAAIHAMRPVGFSHRSPLCVQSVERTRKG
jgi:hypothetical protein